jgi:hypothetical protein
MRLLPRNELWRTMIYLHNSNLGVIDTTGRLPYAEIHITPNKQNARGAFASLRIPQ